MWEIPVGGFLDRNLAIVVLAAWALSLFLSAIVVAWLTRRHPDG